MFKMRIINLVNISTVLLLINLLQTKSQSHGEQYVTVLTVSIYDALLSDKMTGVLVPWNDEYKNRLSLQFVNLAAESCNIFLAYVKTHIAPGSNEGLCTNPIFQQRGSGERGVNLSLSLSFIYLNARQPSTVVLLTKLQNSFENFQSTYSHKITTANFLLYETDVQIPRGDKDAIDGSKWKLIAIITSVTLIIVLIVGVVAKFGNCC
uniref:Egg protein CP3842 n=1 Tax=Schistosoma japonicum TaxID=6182 RepID=C7TYA2_SCHJA|nr:hypothetical protein [Schistosoma japonicum]CAX82811.1 hypothetical protein [Schistosoma japonicum]CAX82855.1 hypothetical protein [Schistosoma japonicum]CAX82966.1 hypothetical protein [Schistosoma japonicum]